MVLPSLPGYGFSGQPTEVGWDADRIGKAWAELMRRLGYTRYVAQGGDQGAGVTDAMARRAPDGLLGVHFNFLDAVPRELLMAALNLRLAFSDEERAQFNKVVGIFKRGYIAEMGEHPQTIGYPLLDSPLGLAAWMLDHDADSYVKIARAFLGGETSGGLTRASVLDNITLYWLTGTGASTSRLYWETGRGSAAAPQGAPASRLAPGCVHLVPRRDLPGPAPLGEERLPQPHLLQRGRQGRPLRSLGRARPVLDGDASGVPISSINDLLGRLHRPTWRGLSRPSPGCSAPADRGGRCGPPSTLCGVSTSRAMPPPGSAVMPGAGTLSAVRRLHVLHARPLPMTCHRVPGHGLSVEARWACDPE